MTRVSTNEDGLPDILVPVPETVFAIGQQLTMQGVARKALFLEMPDSGRSIRWDVMVQPSTRRPYESGTAFLIVGHRNDLMGDSFSQERADLIKTSHYACYSGETMPIDPSFIEMIILTCVEESPVDFRKVDESEVKKVQTAIRRATVEEGASFRNAVTRKNFLCGCLDFTENLPEEHLIVGYGYRNRNTTDIERVHHVVGEEREVAIPAYVRAEISRHQFHRTDAEIIVFHNHPRTGTEPKWLYTLKSLLQDLPIASNTDRRALQYHAFSTVGVLRSVFGQGRVLFYLGESGFVKAIQLPPILDLLDRLNVGH